MKAIAMKKKVFKIRVRARFVPRVWFRVPVRLGTWAFRRFECVDKWTIGL